MYFKFLFLLLLAINCYAAQTRIINGADVADDNEQWRFAVSYQYNNEHNCGGSLIAPTWVLSAAHCWMDPLTDQDTISLGSYHLDEQRDIVIKRVIVHPDYDADTSDNDLLLFELNSSVTDIAPMLLDRTSALAPHLESWVAGWGTTVSGGSLSSPTLKEALTPIVDFDTCNQSYQSALTSNMICAGYMEGGKDSCQGDSGGPLISNYHGQWVQSGIVSWGEGCAQEGFPGVYTKVQNYIDWIEQYTGALPQPVEPTTTSPMNPSVILYLLNASTP